MNVKKAKKENSTKAWRCALLYTLCLLILFSATILILLNTLRKSTEQTQKSEVKEIYVYLPQEESEHSETEENPDSAEPVPEEYLVREHHGQIGIFSSNGTLLGILDTYVKTLPEADRNLLREGISVKTKAELNSMIEDYSH